MKSSGSEAVESGPEGGQNYSSSQAEEVKQVDYASASSNEIYPTQRMQSALIDWDAEDVDFEGTDELEEDSVTDKLSSRCLVERTNASRKLLRKTKDLLQVAPSMLMSYSPVPSPQTVKLTVDRGTQISKAHAASLE